MVENHATNSLSMTATVQQRRALITWCVWFGALLSLTGVTALFMVTITPAPIPLGAVVLAAIVGAIAYRPRFGLYMALFFALLGDATLMPAYPFAKNLSSRESLLYIHDALIFSPLEFCLLITTASWLLRSRLARRFTFYTGPLFYPAMAFTLFLITGLIYGLARGGDVNIALWEVRPVFYLPLVLVLVSNLLTRAAHILQMMGMIMAALVIEGLIGTHYYFAVLGGDLTGVDRITEHAAAVHMNTFFVFLLAVLLYGALPRLRYLLPLLMTPIVITYLATQRRAAFIGLGVALLLLAVLLFWENRKRFWFIAPAGLALLVAYTIAFWTSGSTLALPAQAVRSVLAPVENSSDYLSNLYRMIENVNTSFTIHQAPLTGVGFGNKMFIIIPMPDISFFIWWEYITHNSIFWIWMKTGLFGFLTLLFFIAVSIGEGVRAIGRPADPALRAVVATATIYLVMHFLYGYVDMSWDTQSMLYVGAMAGLINGYARLAVPPPPARADIR